MADSQYDRPKTPESAFFLDHFRYSHSLWFIKVLSQFPSLFLQYDEDYFSSRDVKWTCQFSYLNTVRLHFAIEISDDNDVCARLKMYSLIIKKTIRSNEKCVWKITYIFSNNDDMNNHLI